MDKIDFNNVLKLTGKILLQSMIIIVMMIYYLIKSVVLFFVPRSLRFKDINNEVVLITGGGGGLGGALALRFAQRGARIVIWDVVESGINETCDKIKKIGGQAYGYQVDITDREQVYSTAEKVRHEVGPVTILVNNAGIVTGKRLLEIPDEKIIQTFNVNVISHFWTLKAFLPYMMTANHGHLVSIASVAAYIGAVKLTNYCSSKSAAAGLEESIRMELRHDGYDGIHSTCVCPYFINTGMFAGIQSKILPFLQTEDVADAIITGVLTNQQVIAIPRIFYSFHCLKAILPWDVLYLIYETMGGFDTMKNFVGKQFHENDKSKNVNYDHNSNVKSS